MALKNLESVIGNLKTDLDFTPLTDVERAYKAFGLYLKSLPALDPNPEASEPQLIKFNLPLLPSGCDLRGYNADQYRITKTEYDNYFKSICRDDTDGIPVIDNTQIIARFGTTTSLYSKLRILEELIDSDTKTEFINIFNMPSGADKKLKIKTSSGTYELDLSDVQFEKLRKITIGGVPYHNPVINNTVIIEINDTAPNKGKIIKPESSSFVQTEFTDKINTANIPNHALADYETAVEIWYKHIGIEQKKFNNGVRCPYPHELTTKSWEYTDYNGTVYQNIDFSPLTATEISAYNEKYKTIYIETARSITMTDTTLKDRAAFNSAYNPADVNNSLDTLEKIGIINSAEKATLNNIIGKINATPGDMKSKIELKNSFLPDIVPAKYSLHIDHEAAKLIEDNRETFDKIFEINGTIAKEPIEEKTINLAGIHTLTQYHNAIRNATGLKIGVLATWDKVGINRVNIGGAKVREPFIFETTTLTETETIIPIIRDGHNGTIKIKATTDAEKDKPRKFYKEYIKDKINTDKTALVYPPAAIGDTIDATTFFNNNDIKKCVKFDETSDVAQFNELKNFILNNMIPDPSAGEEYAESCITVYVIPSYVINADITKPLKVNIKKSAFVPPMDETTFYTLLNKIGDFDQSLSQCKKEQTCNRNKFIKSELNRVRTIVQSKPYSSDKVAALSLITELLSYLDDVDYTPGYVKFMGAIVSNPNANNFETKLEELLIHLRNLGVELGGPNTPILPIRLSTLSKRSDETANAYELRIAKLYAKYQKPDATEDEILPAEGSERAPYPHERMSWKGGKLRVVSSEAEVDPEYKNESDYYRDNVSGRTVVHKRRLITGRKRISLEEESHKTLIERLKGLFNKSILKGMAIENAQYEDDAYANRKARNFGLRLLGAAGIIAAAEIALATIPNPLQPVAAAHMGWSVLKTAGIGTLQLNGLISIYNWISAGRNHLDRQLIGEINEDYSALAAKMDRLTRYATEKNSTNVDNNSVMTNAAARALLAEIKNDLKKLRSKFAKLRRCNRRKMKSDLTFDFDEVTNNINFVGTEVTRVI